MILCLTRILRAAHNYLFSAAIHCVTVRHLTEVLHAWRREGWRKEAEKEIKSKRNGDEGENGGRGYNRIKQDTMPQRIIKGNKREIQRKRNEKWGVKVERRGKDEQGTGTVPGSINNELQVIWKLQRKMADRWMLVWGQVRSSGGEGGGQTRDVVR